MKTTLLAAILQLSFAALLCTPCVLRADVAIDESRMFAADNAEYLNTLKMSFFSRLRSMTRTKAREHLIQLPCPKTVVKRVGDVAEMTTIRYFQKSSRREVSFTLRYRGEELDEIWWSQGAWEYDPTERKASGG
ncbi:hypothetical protein DB347_09530 [Opitutaceae bacterium EW11]|nr:hypothetical protein DB347_09600 [Opitutaceae bacterium EW11]PTY07071.1 hypothetical protein DB347_09530 [Opitutaceae bacterium EW11]